MRGDDRRKAADSGSTSSGSGNGNGNGGGGFGKWHSDAAGYQRPVEQALGFNVWDSQTAGGVEPGLAAILLAAAYADDRWVAISRDDNGDGDGDESRNDGSKGGEGEGGSSAAVVI